MANSETYPLRGSGSLTLQSQGLTRGFGSAAARATVLREAGISLYSGEIALLMGPSGSGKSTMLAILSGLLRPDAGQVLALGEDLWALPDDDRKRFRLRHYGFIFQGYNLFPALAAWQQLEMVLRWGEGKSARQARRLAEEMLGRLGLGHKLGLRPSELSGGEKQRVAIGRALIKQPSLCFADEPTAALDWTHGQQVIELLRDSAHRNGTTVLVVTHDHRLLPYADRVFEMEDGRLVQSTTTVLTRSAS